MTRLLACVLLVTVASGLRAEDVPLLPDVDAFLAATQENLARSNRVQDEFAYKERRTELHTNPFGRLGTGEAVLYEVTPLTDGTTGFTRRVLARNGQPVTDGKVERVERRPRREAPRSRSVDDVVATLEFVVDRREMLDARPAVVVKFRPRPNARPQTRQGRLARAFSGEVWVDEQEREVRRVDAVAVDSISYGLGVVARLGKGATVTLLREPVDRDVWLPTTVRFQGQGRALLFRKLNVDYEVEWFDYRRLAGTPG
jgi:hypothetical protein